MISSASKRGVVTAVGAVAALFVFQCSQPATVGGGAGGNSGGKGGSFRNDAAADGGAGDVRAAHPMTQFGSRQCF